MSRPIASLRLALAFLTILPSGLRGEPPPLGATAAWFPAVGALVGAIAGALGYVAEPALGALVAAVLAVAILVGLTGALHQDGLADCADGLGVHGDRERRLAVMRDPSVGTFGTLALLVWFVLMGAALAGLDRGDALRALVLAAAIARWAALLHAVLTRPARPEGLGARFAVGVPALAIATLMVLAAAVVLAGLGPGLAAVAAGALCALLVSAWSRRSVGGRTGDTLGATVAIAEAAVVVTLLGLLAS